MTDTYTADILEKISGHLNMIALCAMQDSGLVHVNVTDDGNFETRLLSPEERAQRLAPAPRLIPVMPSTLHGDGGPMTWVFTCPAPYNDVSILCSPDGESPLGMRCAVERKVRGGETQKFAMTFMEKE